MDAVLELCSTLAAAWCCDKFGGTIPASFTYAKDYRYYHTLVVTARTQDCSALFQPLALAMVPGMGTMVLLIMDCLQAVVPLALGLAIAALGEHQVSEPCLCRSLSLWMQL